MAVLNDIGIEGQPRGRLGRALIFPTAIASHFSLSRFLPFVELAGERVLPCFVPLMERYYCSYFLCSKVPARHSVKQPPFFLGWREHGFCLSGYSCLI